MNVFVTGANRGIGLEFVRQLTTRGETVLASCRHPEKAHDLKSLLSEGWIIPMDVTIQDSIVQGAKVVRKKFNRIDLLINNAGVMGERGNPDIPNWDIIMSTFLTNAAGPVFVTKYLKTLLKKGSKVVNISTLMGSIEDNSSGGYYAYRMSKAALNMASKNLYHELGVMGVTVLTFHPGLVQTDMGGSGANLSVETSVSEMLNVIESAGPEKSGTFLRFDGERLPW